MTIRRIELSDLPRLKTMEVGHDWEFGPDFLHGLALVDEEDSPVVFVGAWRRAEVHCIIDPKWKTPGMRLSAFREIHRAMEVEMKSQGVGEVVTWFDRVEKFCRRLKSLGWVESKKTSFHKVVR